ncbi:MAG: hypothetical protein HBSAPP02_14660 [Phycisphaerae bacterium]|nr:MAG: hypothetical protein DCC66_01645 [Planctomycetota bacterium]GJQ26434.1 MAG: hypothetical protein HBSAPP02_14660 [Phycisphaerae bacterium]
MATIALSSLLIGPLNAQRAMHQLSQPPVPREVQPSLLLTPLLALGRAVIVDYLWLRATKLKEEGRTFDAYQLARRICELQPKFAAVWAFQGWNMAYNISVTLKTPEERWRWVKNGYELIRDKGIPLNPNSTQLYRELSWILFHKVGDFMDEMHSYYKLQFALQMEDILGPPPDGWVKPGRVEGDYYRDYPYDALAVMPVRFEELLKGAVVRRLVDALRGFDFDVSRPGVYLSLLGNLKTGEFQVANAAPGEQEDRKVALKKLMEDPELADARTALERYWRAWRLRNEVKLDPVRIVAMQKGFELTLDFRLPEAHALYWANMGMEKGADPKTRLDIHRLNTNRIEFFCLQKMFHRGRLTMSRQAKLGEPPLMSPDVRVIPALMRAFLEDSKEYLKTERQQSPVSENFKSTFVNFMRTAILRLHEQNQNAKARELFDYLAKTFPDPMYERGLDGFLEAQFKFDREINDYPKALARVEALIARGLLEYAYDEDESALRYLNRAREVYDGYHKSIVSGRQKFSQTFPQMVQRIAHEYGGRMYRATYENICAKLGIPPLPPGEDTATTRPS